MDKVTLRAWSTIEERMISWQELRTHNLWNVLTKPKNLGLILMQYTGLCDNTYEDIFEGDIVRVTHDEYFIREVCTVVWGLDNDDVYPAFHMPELDTESNSFSEVFNVDGYFVKVIGNIYQNKDLLEDK